MLPQINVNFFEERVNAIRRGERGVVALIVKDDTPSFTTKEYKRVDKVESTEFTAENLAYIKDVFKGKPSKVIIEVVAVEGDIQDALTRLKTKRFNYLAMPEAEALDKTAITEFITNSNELDNRTFKTVLANEAADNEAIINFTTEEIVVEDKTYTSQEFTARIAGLLAGLGLDRSATYYVLDEVESIKAIAEPDEAIENGELILIDDGEKIKIGRAVNSLTTTTETKGESFKKIKIVEGVHLMKEDIRKTFEDYYVGKYTNDYDNKVLFTTAVNAYFRQLEKGYVLDRSYPNKSEVSLDAQIEYVESKGILTDGMTEQAIKEYNTGANVFIKANVKFVDAMEDLEFNVYM